MGDEPVSWTRWRKIADWDYWYDDDFDYDGAACYELGVGGPHGGSIHPVYVGETRNERRRLSDYARHGSHLSAIIDDHLRQGFTLHYRAMALPSKAAAKRMQDSLMLRMTGTSC